MNELEVATIVFKSLGDPQRVLDYDIFLDQNVKHWLAREIRLNNRATDVSNLFWFEALYREWASNSAKVFAAPQP